MDWFVKAFLKSSLAWLTLGVTLGVAMADGAEWVDGTLGGRARGVALRGGRGAARLPVRVDLRAMATHSLRSHGTRKKIAAETICLAHQVRIRPRPAPEA